jgi:hypothetical protein
LAAQSEKNIQLAVNSMGKYDWQHILGKKTCLAAHSGKKTWLAAHSREKT